MPLRTPYLIVCLEPHTGHLLLFIPTLLWRYWIFCKAIVYYGPTTIAPRKMIHRLENTYVCDHHDFLLENLLIKRNILIINTPPKAQTIKRNKLETKNLKLQNKNICLTYLDTESSCKREQSQACLGYAECSQGSPRGNERNFHYLSSE